MATNILLTGIDGYVGWATALKLSRLLPEARIIGVDSLGRRRWVEESGSVSAVPVATMEDRLAAAAEHGMTNISFIKGDLADRAFVNQLFAAYRFDTVLHAAAQPSAPYSQINGERASFTLQNNTQMLLNLLWAVKENGLAESCRFVETTTTGVYGAPAFPIPEGFVTAGNQGQTDTLPYPAMSGSWYHMTKAFDAAHLWLANRQWKMTTIDLRTSIVYGTRTAETALDPRMATRFDFDFYFGIVVNRFCAMALTGHPLTVYGKGQQKKPFISLDDCATSLANAALIERDSKFSVMNQTTETVSIADLAYGVKDAAAKFGVEVEVSHIENPRVEDEEHEMVMENKGFLKLLPGDTRKWADEAASIIESLMPYRETLRVFRDRFMR